MVLLHNEPAVVFNTTNTTYGYRKVRFFFFFLKVRIIYEQQYVVDD